MLYAPKLKKPKKGKAGNLGNLGGHGVAAHPCVVCSAPGDTRMLSETQKKEPRWRATVKKYGVANMWVCRTHRVHGPRGPGESEGRGGVHAGPDPTWPTGKMWHPDRLPELSDAARDVC